MEKNINKKYKSFTSLEQSKKLAEILPTESADMCYPLPCEEKDKPLLEQGGFGSTPCWSLAALLNILPSEFTVKGEYSEITYKIDIRKYALTDDVDLYQIAYRNCKIDKDGHHSWKDMINTGEKEDLLDACYEMILKLHEQKLL